MMFKQTIKGVIPGTRTIKCARCEKDLLEGDVVAGIPFQTIKYCRVCEPCYRAIMDSDFKEKQKKMEQALLDEFGLKLFYE